MTKVKLTALTDAVNHDRRVLVSKCSDDAGMAGANPGDAALKSLRSMPGARFIRSLAGRILLGTIGVVGFFLLLALTYVVHDQSAEIDQAFERRNQSLTDTLAAFAVEHLVSVNYPELEYALSLARRRDESLLLVEVEHQGLSVARLGDAKATGSVYRADVRLAEGNSALIGQVRTVFSTRDNAALKAAAWRDSLATMGVIFVVLLMALRWMLRRTVVKPIQALTERTEQAIARALPESRIQDGQAADDEIDLLDQRFRALLEGLARRDEARDRAERELADYQNNLEATIEARTRELRLAQEEAQRLNRAKSDFLAAASHDLRQPLQAIGLFHGALKATALDATQARIVQNLSISLTSLTDLLNALLDISKLDAGRVKPVPEPVGIERLLTRIDAEFAPLAVEKGLRFKLAFPLRDIAVLTDSRLLQSLLGNLVGNAIKYTERGGVLVGVRERGDDLLFQVWDSGVGIAETDRERIFDEYFQVGNQERDRRKGLGLGLSIVRRLAQLLGTEVRCRSRPGRGSVFEFRLPRLDFVLGDAPGAGDGVGDADDAADFAGRRAVVVEDETLLANAIEIACESVGISVLRFATAEEALASDSLLAADFYVSDFRLPGMDGLHLLDEIARRAGRPINAALLTGETAPERIRAAEASGWPVLFKPVEFSRLLHAWAIRGRALAGWQNIA